MVEVVRVGDFITAPHPRDPLRRSAADACSCFHIAKGGSECEIAQSTRSRAEERYAASALSSATVVTPLFFFQVSMFTSSARISVT